jgi:hypothetical protein
MSDQTENTEELGDDGVLHDFWALSKEEIEALAALEKEDKHDV